MSALAVTISEDALRRLRTVAGDDRLTVLLEELSAFPGAEAYLVGGAVRDAVIGRGDGADLDLVVRGVALEQLSAALALRGAVNVVGKSFGVLKFRLPGLRSRDIDIAWPRTERAGGSGGYRDFAVQSDASLPIERDLERRDFTVNAIAYELRSGAVTDPFGGLADIAGRVLRAVGKPEERFAEDHSRMLRCIRFACQLGFGIAPETWAAVSARMPHLDDRRDGERVVPYETVAKELVKAFDADPAAAARMLFESGALARLMPELAALPSCMQSPEYHSEGNVWTHTLLALEKLRSDEFAALFPGERATAETAIAVLLHDVAKPQTAARQGDRITFFGHAERGSELARAAAERLKLASAGVSPDRLAWMVRMHLFPNLVDLGAVRRTTLEKHFLADPEAGRALLHLACADALASLRPSADGKGAAAPDLSSLRRLLETLAEVAAKRQATGAAPLLTGNDIMTDLAMPPGPTVGALLEELREAQLRDEVTTPEEARAFIRRAHEEADADAAAE